MKLSALTHEQKHVVEKIRRVFSLSSLELLDVLDSKGGDQNRRLYDLSLVAQDWINCGCSVSTNKLHHIIIGDNHSLFDILKEPVVDSELILFVGSRIMIQQTIHERTILCPVF